MWHDAHVGLEALEASPPSPRRPGTLAVSGLWHFAHATCWCCPVSGNVRCACENFDGGELRTRRPRGTSRTSVPSCPRCTSLWHDAHVVGRFLNATLAPGTPVRAGAVGAAGTWHFAQAHVGVAAGEELGRRGCVKVVTLNVSGAWHVSQVVPSSPLCGSWWHDAQAVDAPRKSTTRFASGAVLPRDALVALGAFERRVLAGQGELRARRRGRTARPCRSRPPCGSVSQPCSLNWPAVRRPCGSRRTSSPFGLHLHRGLDVALRARDLLVLARERERRPRVVDLLRRPPRRGVAGRARGAELRLVRIGVAASRSWRTSAP